MLLLTPALVALAWLIVAAESAAPAETQPANDSKQPARKPDGSLYPDNTTPFHPWAIRSIRWF